MKKLEPPPKGHGVYRLDGFKRRGTAYSYGPESGISTVAVRRLRLTPRFGPKLHIILEANPIGRNEPVYDALERDLRNLSLDDVEVTQVELKVVFDRTTHRNRRTVSPTITVPNRCSLGYDDRELIVRKMLIASGIELKVEQCFGSRALMLGELLRPLFRQIAIDPSGDTLLGSSAVKHWPRELLAGIERARLIEPGPNADAQICPGCAHACVLPVSFTSEGGFIQCNQTDVDYGLVEVEPSELRQWHASRSRVVAFIARDMKLSPNDQDGRAVHIRFGTWAGARLRRAIALEFKNSAILRIGDAEIDLSDLMKWDGERVCIDHEELDIRASESADPQTGGKRHQRFPAEAASSC